MSTALLAFAVATSIAAAATPVIRRLALRACLVDRALSSRKIHERPVPRLGGVAIVGAFTVSVLGAIALDGDVRALALADAGRTAGLLLGGLAVATLGLWDDVRGARARHKLLVQIGVALLAWWLGYRIGEVANPFGPPLQLGVLGLPFTVLWIVGVVNALNLMDGLDGLAAGVALIAVSTNAVVAAASGQALLVVLTVAIAGAALGFLLHNFHPASIFMGDTGSMFLGFVLATTSMQANQKSTASVALLVPVVALALPIGDTLLAMSRRAARGAPLFGADREHVHHRLIALGLSHREAVLVLYGAAVVLAASALALATSPGWAATLTLVLALAAGLALGLVRLGYFRMVGAREVADVRRHNLAVRARIQVVGRDLRLAASPEEVWELVRDAAQALGARCVALTFRQAEGNGRRTRVSFEHGFDDLDAGQVRSRHSLFGERAADGVLELGWSEGRKTLDRDTEIAIEALCEHVARALSTVRPAGERAGVPPPPVRRAVGLRREA